MRDIKAMGCGVDQRRLFVHMNACFIVGPEH
jgi:hypothetical protein